MNLLVHYSYYNHFSEVLEENSASRWWRTCSGICTPLLVKFCRYVWYTGYVILYHYFLLYSSHLNDIYIQSFIYLHLSRQHKLTLSCHRQVALSGQHRSLAIREKQACSEVLSSEFLIRPLLLFWCLLHLLAPLLRFPRGRYPIR